MQMPTFTKANLVDAIYEKIDRNKSEVKKELVEDMLGTYEICYKRSLAYAVTGSW